MTINKPRDLAILTSLAISLLTVLSLYLYALFNEISFNVWMLLLLGLGIFVVSAIFIYLSIENFIYYRVRSIYRTINKYQDNQEALREIRALEDPIEKVNAEVDLWAKEKLEEITALRAKENFRREFIGNLAHELKTPVFNIQGYVLTLLEGALEDPEINRKFLLKAAGSLERLNTLLEDLDSISQIESGQYEFSPERYNLILQIEDVFESLERKAKKAKVKLVLDPPSKRELYVYADKSRIQQILTNLIQNSVNYGTEKGQTVIKLHEQGQKVHVTVKDNGIGIEPEELPRIFERFYRVDKSRSRNAGGSGLGLAIVKHILDGHNENIQVNSTPGKGSEFSFTLQKA